MARIYYDLEKYDLALNSFKKSLKMSRDLNRSEKATILSNIGSCYEQLNVNNKALAYYTRSLLMYRQVNKTDEHSNIGIVLNNIASIHYKLNEYQQALEFYEQSLQIYSKLDKSHCGTMAQILNNIGMVLNNMKLYSKAIEFNKKALEIKRIFISFYL
jgi:tetratricopeptide (TPR) repeat protein